MRITFIKAAMRQDSFGGSGVHFQQVSAALARRGHALAAFFDGPLQPGLRQFPRTRWGACWASMWSDVLYMRLNCVGRQPWRLPRSLEMLRHVNGNILAWELNAPVEELLITGRATESEVQRRIALISEAARSVDVAFAVSKEMEAYGRERFRLSNVVYVPNGGNCDQFSPAIHATSALTKERRPVIFWAGSGRYPWEGDDLVIDLAERMRSLAPACLFVMAGNRRDERPLPDNVLHLGGVSHDEIPSLVAAADICLCLYNLEAYGETGFYGSPIKLYEYLAAGKAVVATRVGEIERTIVDERNGMLVSDAEELVDAVRRLVDDAPFRARLGTEARRAAEEFYNWDRAAQQIEEALSGIQRLRRSVTIRRAGAVSGV